MAGISDVFFYFVYVSEFILVQAVTFQHSCSGNLLLYGEADRSLHVPFSHEPSSHKTRSNQFRTSPSFSLQELFMQACVINNLIFPKIPPSSLLKSCVIQMCRQLCGRGKQGCSGFFWWVFLFVCLVFVFFFQTFPQMYILGNIMPIPGKQGNSCSDPHAFKIQELII